MEKLCIPNVKALIEKEMDGEKWIVLQTRNKPDTDPYTQRYEIPGGKIRAYESIYSALKREIKEECGLDLKRIRDGKLERVYEGEDCVETIQPFTVYQMTKGPYPSLGLVFICEAEGELIQGGDETSNPFWISKSELEKQIHEKPETFALLDKSILFEYLRRY
ncbi:hypothetical protein BBF96_09415 [Anoxybacter fermentans]|uniref:Nudix hydrolase domain-containing protein n=1 Tax=Anoxybacter fermentans TaxID=1323375 RepID=A0A3Q9HR51_9FIRM|nr:NUDIX domain-containing protein [Anoxybacter fermentans]AZR73588.1 hypothetical protein BBF96_09415 [Anoxybacter fermentans]